MPVHVELRDDRSEKIRYNSPDYPIYIRRGLLSSYPNFTAPCHWHDDIELIAVLDGKMTYNVNGTLVEIEGGEGIFVNSRQLHFGFSARRQECDFICVLLHPILLCAMPETERNYVMPIVQNAGVPYRKLGDGIPWQREALKIIREMNRSKKSGAAPLRIQAGFFELWALLYENLSVETRSPKPESLDLTITKNMVGFIQQNYTRKISLAEIAASGSVGQSKCCKLFSHYFQKSPMQYLIQYRLNKSIDLLRDTDLSITEIALATGFGGGSYYAETFRKWLGQSPSAYRKQGPKTV